MTTVNAYAAAEADASFESFQYELGDLGAQEVDIAVESCGICHSDLSMLENAWGITAFPFVPGHEVIGKVTAAGDQVAHLSVGDRVGLGWHAGYCMYCDQCLSGHHNLCTLAEPTIAGRHGGFADVVRAHSASVAKIPEALDAKKAGPLLCGGMAVFSPFVELDISPTSSVGVIGIGGLGHLALKFARAWGCEVTAFTSSESKQEEAMSLGAHHAINSRDPDAIQAVARRFDLVINTVNVPLDWNAYIDTLKPMGKLHFLGAVTEPLDINVLPLMFGQQAVTASPVGSPAVIRKMLDFAARHDVAPVTEHFSMEKVNDAMEHLRSGKARYRIVLEN